MSNTCQCPNPPGGQITCSPDQLAVCGFRDGKIVSGCFDRPKRAGLVKDEDARYLLLANWVLSVVSGTPRSDADPINVREYDALRGGRFIGPDGEVVKFSVPNDLDFNSPTRSEPAKRYR